MTTYCVIVKRDGTEISRSFCDDTLLVDFTVDTPSAATHTYTVAVAVWPIGGPGATGHVGFTRLTADLFKR